MQQMTDADEQRWRAWQMGNEYSARRSARHVRVLWLCSLVVALGWIGAGLWGR